MGVVMSSGISRLRRLRPLTSASGGLQLTYPNWELHWGSRWTDSGLAFPL